MIVILLWLVGMTIIWGVLSLLVWLIGGKEL